MEKRTIAPIDGGTTKLSTNVADLKLRMAEHILTQYDCDGTTEILNILNETKVGASRRPSLQNILKMVFAAS